MARRRSRSKRSYRSKRAYSGKRSYSKSSKRRNPHRRRRNCSKSMASWKPIAAVVGLVAVGYYLSTQA